MEFEMGQISGNHNKVYKNAIWKYVFNNMPMGSVSNLNLSFILVGSGQGGEYQKRFRQSVSA